jgi:hypothetical protein
MPVVIKKLQFVNGSLLIVLPHDWCAGQALKKGDEVALDYEPQSHILAVKRL